MIPAHDLIMIYTYLVRVSHTSDAQHTHTTHGTTVSSAPRHVVSVGRDTSPHLPSTTCYVRVPDAQPTSFPFGMYDMHNAQDTRQTNGRIDPQDRRIVNTDEIRTIFAIFLLMRDEPRNEGCSRERQRVPDNRQTAVVERGEIHLWGQQGGRTGEERWTTPQRLPAPARCPAAGRLSIHTPLGISKRSQAQQGKKEYLTSHLPFFLVWRRRGGSIQANRVPHRRLGLGQMNSRIAPRRRPGRRSLGDQAPGRSRSKACRRDAEVDRPRLECRWESANRRRSTNGGGATGVIGPGEMVLRCRGRRARALLGVSIFLAVTLCQGEREIASDELERKSSQCYTGARISKLLLSPVFLQVPTYNPQVTGHTRLLRVFLVLVVHVARSGGP